MPPEKVVRMIHHATALWAPEAAKRLEVAMETPFSWIPFVHPRRGVNVMKRYVVRLAADEATPMSEEEV